VLCLFFTASLILSRLGLNDLLDLEMERLRLEEDCRNVENRSSQGLHHSINDTFQPSPSHSSTKISGRERNQPTDVGSQSESFNEAAANTSLTDLLNSLTQSKRRWPRTTADRSVIHVDQPAITSTVERSHFDCVQLSLSNLSSDSSPSSLPSSRTFDDRPQQSSHCDAVGRSAVGTSSGFPMQSSADVATESTDVEERVRVNACSSSSFCVLSDGVSSSLNKSESSIKDARCFSSRTFLLPDCADLSNHDFSATTDTPIAGQSLAQRTVSRLSKFAFGLNSISSEKRSATESSVDQSAVTMESSTSICNNTSSSVDHKLINIAGDVSQGKRSNCVSLLIIILIIIIII